MAHSEDQAPTFKPVLGLIPAGLSLLLAAMPAGAGDYQVIPIETRPADTQSVASLSGTYRYFTDVTLQEADEFDGWSVDFDLRFPFADRFQLRLFAPVKTKGTARTTTTNGFDPILGTKIDVEGYGDTFEFPSLEFEHQLRFDEESGYDLAYYLGVGVSLKPLETDLNSGDKFNHRGRQLLGGIKYDRQLDNGIQLMGNFGLRYYWESDDLNPNGSDNFAWADIKGAAIFKRWGRIYPVLELTYLGDIANSNALTVVPELVLPFTPNFELKAAMPIGLASEGNQFGGTAQLSYRF